MHSWLELINKVDVFFQRLKRFGYLSHYITVTELMNKSNDELFVKIYYHEHCTIY